MSSGGSPRDKMIGMMYLVLTALLAMNVSKDILNSFITVNDGLAKTNDNFNAKNSDTYANFGKLAEKDPKAKPYYDRAVEVQKISKEMRAYITEIKKKLIMVVDKVADTTALRLTHEMMGIASKDNYDEPTRMMIGSDPANPIAAPANENEPNTAMQLKGKLDELRDKLIKLTADGNGCKFIPGDRAMVEKSVKSSLSTDLERMENGVKETWPTINFDHLPLVAAITNLSKMEADVNNSEAEVVSFLLKSVGANEVRFDQLEAKVIAPSSYILAGDEYKADVLLVASSSTQKNKIVVGQVDTASKKMIGATEELPVERGLGKYVKRTGGEGVQKWGGIIEVAKPDGTVDSYPFTSEYIVAKPAAAISPTKMNVFYIGVENPVDISAAGVSPDNLMPSISGAGGSLSGSKGKYVVKVSSVGECTINVSDKVSKKSMGSMKFRAKSLPTPIAMMNGQKGDCTMKKSLLAASSMVVAQMENFDFDLKVPVTSFDMETVVSGDIMTFKGNGPSITPQMKQAMDKVKNNGRIYITNVKARMPDGTNRTLPGINIRVVL
jgi:gliding motility-associated protein GldM